MEADIKPLKDDSLDEIARLMDDIRRRLALARAGKVVRDEEDAVIAKLEKMIDELEKQRQMQQQKQQQAAKPERQRQPNNPLQDSQRAELKGAGEVDPKNIGKTRRLGQPAAQGAAGSDAADRPRAAGPLPRDDRGVFQAAGPGRRAAKPSMRR